MRQVSRLLFRARIQKVLSEGVQLRERFCCLFSFLFFKLMEKGGGRRIQTPLKAGHHRPARETLFERSFSGLFFFGDPDQ